MSKKIVALLCVVLMLVSLTACQQKVGDTPAAPADDNAPAAEAPQTESEAPVDAEVLTIGVFGPLTGTMAVGGTHQKDGIQYAIDEINANGGLCGGKYTLAAIYEDTEGNSENAVTIMNKFLYKDNVICTMGSNNSPEVLAVLDMIDEAQTPHIVPSGVSMAITASGSEWVYRCTATDVLYSKMLVDYSVNSLKSANIAVMYDTNDYGVGGKNLVEQYLADYSITPAVEEGYATGSKDFSSSLLKVKSAGCDTLILWGNYTEAGQIVKQIRELGLDINIMLSTGATIGNFYELAGADANGCYGVTSGFSTGRTDEVAVNFMEAYAASHDYGADVNVVMAYDATMVLAAAIEAAGSADKTAIRDALKGLVDEGISGAIDFKDIGEGGSATLMYVITDGTNGTVELIEN